MEKGRERQKNNLLQFIPAVSRVQVPPSLRSIDPESINNQYFPGSFFFCLIVCRRMHLILRLLQTVFLCVFRHYSCEYSAWPSSYLTSRRSTSDPARWPRWKPVRRQPRSGSCDCSCTVRRLFHRLLSEACPVLYTKAFGLKYTLLSRKSFWTEST